MFWQQTSDELIQNNELVSRGRKKTHKLPSPSSLIDYLPPLQALLSISIQRLLLRTVSKHKGIHLHSMSKILFCELQRTRKKKKEKKHSHSKHIWFQVLVMVYVLGAPVEIFSNFRFSWHRWLKCVIRHSNAIWAPFSLSLLQFPKPYSMPCHLIYVVRYERDGSLIRLLSLCIIGSQ